MDTKEMERTSKNDIYQPMAKHLQSGQMGETARKNRIQSPDFFKMSGMPKFGK